MKSKIINPYGNEPVGIDPALPSYVSDLAKAFNWYNQEKEKKDARAYLKHYISHHYKKEVVKIFDSKSDSEIRTTFGWVARLLTNGCKLTEHHSNGFKHYLEKLLVQDILDIVPDVEEEVKVKRPSIQDSIREKANEYISDLEKAIDDFILSGIELDLFKDLQSRSIPGPYCVFLDEWAKKKVAEFIYVYESNDEQLKEGYSNLGKRKLSQLIKLISGWIDDIDRHGQFKKANRKPKAKKIKPAGVQIAKLKYKREDSELGIKSVIPTEIVGASQVWVYNTKNKKLAAYRTDSSSGIQVKGTTLQNYDPDMCEQKTLRKPKEVLKEVVNAGKIQLRRIIAELTTKESPVNGRINDECLIVRVIK